MSKGIDGIEKKEIILTNEYKIVRSNGNFNLEYESTAIYKKKHKGVDILVPETFIQYYGTLYQALQGYLTDYVGRNSPALYGVTKVVDEAMEHIDKAKNQIREDWKVVKYIKQ